MEKPSNKFFIYVRKSTDGANRQTLSISAQKSELQEIANRKGISVIRILEENSTIAMR